MRAEALHFLVGQVVESDTFRFSVSSMTEDIPEEASRNSPRPLKVDLEYASETQLWLIQEEV